MRKLGDRPVGQGHASLGYGLYAHTIYNLFTSEQPIGIVVIEGLLKSQIQISVIRLQSLSEFEQLETNFYAAVQACCNNAVCFS